MAVRVEDEAGPYQAVPQAGKRWCAEGHPATQPHEYARGDTAKLLTLFHPQTGELRTEGVTSSTNAVLHPWLQGELETMLARLPVPAPQETVLKRACWETWQVGLSVKFILPDESPPLRLLLVLDNLTGHKTPAFILWLVAHGVMPLYTPLSGSWLNMAESIQRIIGRRALAGTHMELAAKRSKRWKQRCAAGIAVPPFTWGGKRKAHRDRARARRQGYRLGDSDATAPHSLRHSQMTH